MTFSVQFHRLKTNARAGNIIISTIFQN